MSILGATRTVHWFLWEDILIPRFLSSTIGSAVFFPSSASKLESLARTLRMHLDWLGCCSTRPGFAKWAKKRYEAFDRTARDNRWIEGSIARSLVMSRRSSTRNASGIRPGRSGLCFVCQKVGRIFGRFWQTCLTSSLGRWVLGAVDEFCSLPFRMDLLAPTKSQTSVVDRASSLLVKGVEA